MNDDGKPKTHDAPDDISEIIKDGIKSLHKNPVLLIGLRRAARENKGLGECPQAWGLVVNPLIERGYYFDSDSEITPEEWSIYTCLALYSLHMQSKDPQKVTEEMNRPGKEYFLGASAKRLALKLLKKRNEDEGTSEVDNSNSDVDMPRQFIQAIASKTEVELQKWLQMLIMRFKAEDIPLDYSELGKQLYLFSKRPWKRDQVRLSWGREFERFGGGNRGLDNRSVNESGN